jgi:hypothetical protein
MINELTKEQELKVAEYYKKWHDIGHTTQRIDRDKAKEAISWAYEFLEFQKTQTLGLQHRIFY